MNIDYSYLSITPDDKFLLIHHQGIYPPKKGQTVQLISWYEFLDIKDKFWLKLTDIESIEKYIIEEYQSLSMMKKVAFIHHNCSRVILTKPHKSNITSILDVESKIKAWIEDFTQYSYHIQYILN